MSHRVVHRKFGRRRKVGSKKRRMQSAVRHGRRWRRARTAGGVSKRLMA